MSLTRERVLRASDDWQWIPAGSVALDIENVRVVAYPSWARMGFYATPTRVQQPAEVVIAAVQRAARENGRNEISWWISPSTQPPAFEQALIDAGAAVAERTEILAMDIASELPDLQLNPNVECLVVSDAETLDDAERVASAVWGGPPSSGERRATQLAQLGDPLDGTGGFRVVAYLNGDAIATAGCQVADEVARLYGAGTLVQARGLGAYRAMIAKRVEVASAHGARVALVHARVGTSLPILTRIGFESFGEARLYKLAA